MKNTVKDANLHSSSDRLLNKILLTYHTNDKLFILFTVFNKQSPFNIQSINTSLLHSVLCSRDDIPCRSTTASDQYYNVQINSANSAVNYPIGLNGHQVTEITYKDRSYRSIHSVVNIFVIRLILSEKFVLVVETTYLKHFVCEIFL